MTANRSSSAHTTQVKTGKRCDQDQNNTLFGTLFVASGTATLNQYIERDFDAQMRRTARRPLAAGRLKSQAVLVLGTALSVAGTVSSQ
jgi:heme O synthase-like polyprenyltransferase